MLQTKTASTAPGSIQKRYLCVCYNEEAIFAQLSIQLYIEKRQKQNKKTKQGFETKTLLIM